MTDLPGYAAPRQPSRLRTGRKQVVILLLLGTLIASMMGGVGYAIVQNQRHERQRQLDRIADRADKVRSDNEIARIARRVVRIEKPTPAQLNAAVIAALKVCEADRRCRNAFMDAAPRGRRGPQGRAGAQGPAGARGPQGRTGPRGAAGRTGARGPRGPQGAQGAPGAAGVATSAADVIAAICARSTAIRVLICR